MFKSDALYPMIDLIENIDAAKELISATNEYIANNRHRARMGECDCNVFYVSGMAQYHHQRLADYLNAAILKREKPKAIVRYGGFLNFPSRHCWVKVNGIIIDIAIKQFAAQLAHFPIRVIPASENFYFISDNIQNPLYSCYQERDNAYGRK